MLVVTISRKTPERGEAKAAEFITKNLMKALSEGLGATLFTVHELCQEANFLANRYSQRVLVSHFCELLFCGKYLHNFNE